MGTLAELKTRVASEVHRSDLTSDIATAINRAIKFYQGRRFSFNQTRATLTTTAGTEFYTTTTANPSTLPSDIGEIDRITVTVGTRRTPLEPISPQELEDLASDTGTRQEPSRFAWYAGQLRLHPIPDQAYTLTLSYLQKADADASTSVWTTEAEDLICHAAKKRIFRDVLYDAEAAGMAAQAEVDEYRRLTKDAKQLSTGGLRGSW